MVNPSTLEILAEKPWTYLKLPWGCSHCIWLAPVSILSVSAQIVAGRDDFAERGCEPQDVGSDRRAGFVKTVADRQSPCGSQTRAPLVAASPRSAVSQSWYVFSALQSCASCRLPEAVIAVTPWRWRHGQRIASWRRSHILPICG